MCQGRIIKTYHSNEPILAYKEELKGYPWRANLRDTMYREFQPAKARLIGRYGSEPLMLGFKSTKSILAFLHKNYKCVDSTAHLSGWHAYKHRNDVPSNCVHPVLLVELRGFIQESDEGEIVGSEMRVLGEEDRNAMSRM